MSEYINLTDEEKQMVEEFSEKIDINDSEMIIRYGSVSQDKIAKYSDTILNNITGYDWSITGELITKLVDELKDLFEDGAEKKGFFGLFGNNKGQVEKLIERIKETENNIDVIVIELEGYLNRLLKDNIMLKKTYESNLKYIKEITMYIMAGRKKLQLGQDETIKALEEKYKNSGDIIDNQKLEEFKNNCDLFDKKLYELEISQNISIQMAAQIRMIQSSNMVISEKINTALKNTIPLWKNEMANILQTANLKEVDNIQDDLNVKNLNQELITTFSDMENEKKEDEDKRIKAEKELEMILNNYKRENNNE